MTRGAHGGCARQAPTVVFDILVANIRGGAPGVLVTFSPHVWYPIDPRTASVRGLVIRTAAGVIFLVVGVALFCAWPAEAEPGGALAERRMHDVETKEMR
jgi:hypothetical protein